MKVITREEALKIYESAGIISDNVKLLVGDKIYEFTFIEVSESGGVVILAEMIENGFYAFQATNGENAIERGEWLETTVLDDEAEMMAFIKEKIGGISL